MATRRQFVSLDGEAGATWNTRAAASLVALDMPLDKHRTLTTMAGDGIQGLRVTWHFKSANQFGQSSDLMVKAWDDRDYHSRNPDCPLVRIKAAFIRSDELTRRAKDRTLECKPTTGPFIETPHIQTAAAMEQLGHAITGIAFRDGKYWFRFSQASASDFALWTLPPGELEKRLPEALIAYLWCSFDNHRVMVDFIKNVGPQFAAVQHRGRTAMIGKDMSKDEIDKLERLLTRR